MSKHARILEFVPVRAPLLRLAHPRALMRLCNRRDSSLPHACPGRGLVRIVFVPCAPMGLS